MTTSRFALLTALLGVTLTSLASVQSQSKGPSKASPPALRATASYPAPAGDPLAGKRTNVLASCSWNSPGQDPFMGDVVAAVDRYRDIPSSIRERLKSRMAQRQYDDFVTIRRESIDGKHSYAPGIRDMHFGNNRLCLAVNRGKWPDSMTERGLVYCESGHCLIVPTVCRNVSRITRHEIPAVATLMTPPAELEFEPPAAGPAPESFEAQAAMPELILASAPPAAAPPPVIPPPPGGGEGGGSGFGSGFGAGFGFGGGFGGGGGGGGSSSSSFSSSSVSVTVSVTATATAIAGASSIVVSEIDGITTPIPEPAEWMQMLLGLFAVGYVVARRRRRNA